ncbi:MAG: EscU/YscU/HrcU family type III secretion system export apparatus switch protein, partial [Cohnella sp.]|nr:EscU/YscU/HrcU family type III secretion system export apparatus switch protein [Cohnella sp.]
MDMNVTEENVLSLMTYYLIEMAKFLGPIFFIIILIIFASSYVQIGWLLTFESLKPKLSSLNPISGAKNLFGMRAVVEFLKSSLKLLVVAIVV